MKSLRHGMERKASNGLLKRTALFAKSITGNGIALTLKLLYFCSIISSLSASCNKNPLIQKEKIKLYASTNISGAGLLSSEYPIKVMSFNIRHNDPSDPQTIDERLPLMVNIIKTNQPDIFGVQEFSNNPFRSNFVDSMSGNGYSDYWVVDTVTHGSPKVIFYKNNRFSVINGGAFGLGTDNRSAEWAIFHDQQTNEQYFFCNSHWGLSAAERLVHSQNLADAIHDLNTGHLPVILFGDFNAQPGTPEITHLKNELDLTDALGDELGEPTFHAWSATGKYKIDWIMCDRNFCFTSFKVITTNYNGYWPSDHWPVMATFVPAIFGTPNSDIHGTSASHQTTFYFADVDGDGKDDKIYWNPTFESGQSRVFLSNGNGTFTYADDHMQSASTSTSTKFYFADVNGDHKADLISWNPTLNSGHTRVYLATTGGTFSTSVVDNPGGISTSNSTTFYFADLNGDELQDKIYWNPGNFSGQTVVYLATGSGNFASAILPGSAGASTAATTRFYFADVNGDGKADKVMWSPTLNTGKTMVYLSNGDGTFSESSSFSNSGATGLASTTKFFFSDINGDGKADKIYWNPANFSGQLKAYFSDGSKFNGPYYSLRGTSESTATQFYFNDINGDSRADQIRWNYSLESGALRNYMAN
ncbi:FG-GAP-like repeat-containing protein [Arachidicoccus terrestris]|uniref:FG-GAP-like repeat-containing protein n=1 Tax=Arachidicoccus terrestris TaxID=2875539 RepID=UPI001CC371B8|nr:FG-GAP-like repeat-containing protein [Arachidicoccus terrestris]UAY56958.1 FG-GAP-like repeat-containing protein [Arachidicoccus terrestris]